MNRVWVKEVDSRSCPYPHKKSHNNGRCSNFFFPPTIIPPFYFALVCPLSSSWNSFIKTFVAGQPLKVIAFWIQFFVWLYYLIYSLVRVSKQVAKWSADVEIEFKSWFIDFFGGGGDGWGLNLAAFQAGVMHS